MEPKKLIRRIPRDDYTSQKNMTPAQQRQYRYNRAKAYLKSSPSIGNFYNALKTILGGNDPKNPYLQVGEPIILPGYQIKPLIQGNQLVEQLSKAGTVSTNAIKALADKSSKFEGRLLNSTLDSQFPNQRVVDYNSLRQAIQSQLIPYTTKETTKYSTYGMDRLGLDDYQFINGQFIRPTPVTFTFESSKIPMGNNLHYDKNTLGHTRAFTQGDEVLSVLESQSDWAQHPWGVVAYNKMSKAAPHRLSYLRKVIAQQKEQGIPTQSVQSRIPYQEQYNNIPSDHIQHLQSTYPQRQLQENMLYASKNGYKKMRYPTRSTAIKVEGYEPTLLFQGHPELEQKALTIQEQIGYIELQLQQGTNMRNYVKLSNKLQGLKKEYEILKSQSTGQIYSPQEETILKRYEQFPKMFGKVFKDQKPQIIQDSKGNSWFEFAIPKDMQQRELMYKYGGKL